MAHAVENMFSVRQTPWHGLGKVLRDNPTIEQGLIESGLDWPVECAPLYVTAASGGYSDISAFGKAIRRVTDGSILGVVGPDYTPLQNAKAFEFFRPFLDSGECHLTTAGSLYNGRVVWVMAELNRDPMEIRAGDIIRKYLLLSNSHDGTRAVKISFTPIRVVCANTLAMSDDSRDSMSMRIRHTINVESTLTDIRETINLVNQSFECTADIYRSLANKGVNENDLRNYMKVLVCANPLTPTKQEEQSIAECVTRAISATRGNGNGTAWDAYNGFTEYLSYATRHRSTDARMNSLWFGDNSGKLTQALDLAIAL